MTLAPIKEMTQQEKNQKLRELQDVPSDEIHVYSLNATYMKIQANVSVLLEISDFFTFEVPNARFTPKYKMGIWDGKIRLFNAMHQTLYSGLLSHLRAFADERKYKVISKSTIDTQNNVSHESFKTFLNSLNIHSNGIKLIPRDYQEKAIIHCIRNKRATIVSPTSSGKSYIIYSIARWYRSRPRNKKILLIVPSVSLVNQMYEDFKDYASEDNFSTSLEVHKVFAGQQKDTKKGIMISTWQSMMKQPKKYFEQFDMVITDEVHKASGAHLARILEQCINAHYRYGFTGTLNDAKTHKLNIFGLHGPERKTITTKQLMDRGEIAKLDIMCIVLKYNQDDVKTMKMKVRDAKKSSNGGATVAYKAEIDYVVQHKGRMKQLLSLCEAVEGNALVLFQYVESHGKVIHDLLLTNSKKRVYYISGETKADERERIRQTMETTSDTNTKVLHFDDKTIEIKYSDDIPLTDGTLKKGRYITVDDDIKDEWIFSNV